MRVAMNHYIVTLYVHEGLEKLSVVVQQRNLQTIDVQLSEVTSNLRFFNI